MEARVGFEPTNGGFADLSLRPLGYRAECLSIAKQPSTCQRDPREEIFGGKGFSGTHFSVCAFGLDEDKKLNQKNAR